jgi:hypothetical protein
MLLQICIITVPAYTLVFKIKTTNLSETLFVSRSLGFGFGLCVDSFWLQ